jgi:hypothetical protein
MADEANLVVPVEHTQHVEMPPGLMRLLCAVVDGCA